MFRHAPRSPMVDGTPIRVKPRSSGRRGSRESRWQGSWNGSGSSRHPGGAGGSCHRPHCRSTWRSARPTPGACSSRRWRRAWASPASPARCRSPSGIIMLGLSAALFGTRVDSNGPRWAMVVSSSCFVAGFLISALGLYLRQYWLVVLGYGFVGGIGLGIGYISPVSTLIKWFPDRPGLATGIAIMGFGGGALIASPLTNQLLSAFGGSGANPDRRRDRPDVPGDGPDLRGVHVGRLAAHPRARAGLEARRVGPGARQDRLADHHGERLGRATRSRPRSSGCCGSSCAST